MISVERILQYSNLQSESPLLIEDSRPPNNWPQIGTICFKNLQVKDAYSSNTKKAPSDCRTLSTPNYTADFLSLQCLSPNK